MMPEYNHDIRRTTQRLIITLCVLFIIRRRWEPSYAADCRSVPVIIPSIGNNSNNNNNTYYYSYAVAAVIMVPS